MDRKEIGIVIVISILSFFIGSMVSSNDLYITKQGETFKPSIMEYHVDVYYKGKIISHHAGTLTNYGKDIIEYNLANSSSTKITALYIGLSSNSSTPLSTWTHIPNEIASGGLNRASGTYESLGYGNWKITKTFTASSTITNLRLTGLYCQSTGYNLLCADVFSPISLNSGDSITIVYNMVIT